MSSSLNDIFVFDNVSVWFSFRHYIVEEVMQVLATFLIRHAFGCLLVNLFEFGSQSFFLLDYNRDHLTLLIDLSFVGF